MREGGGHGGRQGEEEGSAKLTRARALRTQIIWCEDCGEGWYISGGRFLDVTET